MPVQQLHGSAETLSKHVTKSHQSERKQKEVAATGFECPANRKGTAWDKQKENKTNKQQQEEQKGNMLLCVTEHNPG